MPYGNPTLDQWERLHATGFTILDAKAWRITPDSLMYAKIMFVYILKNTSRRFRYKIGISKHPQTRQKQVYKSEPCRVVFCVPLFFSRAVEVFLKRKYRHLQRTLTGSGKTEWYYFWIPIRPALWLLWFFTLQLAVLAGLVGLIRAI